MGLTFFHALTMKHPPCYSSPSVSLALAVRAEQSVPGREQATADGGGVKRVSVNGQEARSLRPNFAEWEVILADVKPGERKLSAHAEDAAGNVEKRPHVRSVVVPK